MTPTRATHEQIDALMERVPSHLPGRWLWKPNPSDWAPGGHLVEDESSRIPMEIYVGCARHNKPGMLHVSAVAPKDSQGQVPYVVSKDLPGINVSVAKTPAQVAQEIERRLLSLWEPFFVQALDTINRSNKHQDVVKNVMALIAEVVGVEVSRHDADNHRVSFYRSPHPIFGETSSEAVVHGDDVSLTLQLSHSDAVTLLMYLRSWSKS